MTILGVVRFTLSLQFSSIMQVKSPYHVMLILQCIEI